MCFPGKLKLIFSSSTFLDPVEEGVTHKWFPAAAPRLQKNACSACECWRKTWSTPEYVTTQWTKYYLWLHYLRTINVTNFSDTCSKYPSFSPSISVSAPTEQCLQLSAEAHQLVPHLYDLKTQWIYIYWRSLLETWNYLGTSFQKWVT